MNTKALGVIFIALGISGGVAWAASDDTWVVYACAGLAFLVQWVAFVPAYVKQTERFYDLTGSVTYLSVVWLAVLATGRLDVRSLVLAGLVTVWAGRLGTFLFKRILREGKDGRFDDIKPKPARFLVAWTLQGLWVFLTLAAALAAITSSRSPELGVLDAVGLAVWATGFSIEVVADRQKSAFREAHPGRFIDTGLWAWSRHPNYFGEITLWTGVAIIASSVLTGAQWVTWISPVFVTVLLTRISGIPMLEKRSDERWGDEPAYQAYKERTPVLIPRPPA